MYCQWHLILHSLCAVLFGRLLWILKKVITFRRNECKPVENIFLKNREKILITNLKYLSCFKI